MPAYDDIQPPQAHGKYDNNGKGKYFRFDDDNKIILSIT